MKLLLDHNLPKRLRAHPPGHEVKTTREMRWEKLRNGELLRSAAAGGFDGVVTVDKNIEHEQNLALLPLAVIVMDASSNALPGLLPLIPLLQGVLVSPLDRLLYVIQLDGTVLRLTQPR
jgi:hypothetical protein